LGNSAINLLMIVIISQHSSVVGDNCRHPRVGPKLREPVARTEPAHGPINITVAELAGGTALGAPLRGLFCFSVAGGRHGAALRRAQQACVKLVPSLAVRGKLTGNPLPYNLIPTGRRAPFSLSGVANQAPLCSRLQNFLQITFPCLI